MRVLKEGGIYLFSSLLEKALPFILLPFLTRYLTASEFGIVAVFVAVSSLFSTLIDGGLNGFVRVIFHKVREDDFKLYIGSVLTIAIVFFVLIGVFVFFTGASLADWVGLDFSVFFLALLLALLLFFVNLRLSIFQASRQAERYLKLQILKPIFDVIFVVGFVFFLEWEAEGRIYAVVLAAFLSFLWAIKLLNSSELLYFKYRKTHVLRICKFVVSMLPRSLALTLVFTVDKIILSSTISLTFVGELAVALSVAAPTMIIADVVNRTFVPWSYEKFNEKRHKVVVSASYLLILVMTVICLIYYYLVTYFFDVLIGEQYSHVVNAALILIWAGWFKLGYYLVVKGLVYTENVIYLAFVTVISALVYLSLLVANIDVLNIDIVAYNMIFFHFLMFVMAFLLSQKFYPQPWSDLSEVKNIVRSCRTKG